MHAREDFFFWGVSEMWSEIGSCLLANFFQEHGSLYRLSYIILYVCKTGMLSLWSVRGVGFGGVGVAIVNPPKPCHQTDNQRQVHKLGDFFCFFFLFIYCMEKNQYSPPEYT